MHKTPITLKNKRERQLEMLDEVDVFCRNNQIRYSLASGTLLGAIRHKGFIPWDDDMDIVMPEPDFLKFYSSFNSKDIKCEDVKNSQYFHFPWAKICDTRSYSLPGKVVVDHGIDIDLYIVHGLPSSDDAITAFYKKMNRLCNLKKFLVKLRFRLIRKLPIKTIPFYEKTCRKHRDLSFSNSYVGSKKYIFHSDMMDWAHTYDCDLFEQMIDVQFEGHKYMAIKSWDKYLTQRYGNYMQLPPESERHPVHGGRFYVK